MHKLLAGLLDQHRHTEAPRALAVATRLAEHLWRRFERVASLGLERWRTFINQEVGGMSEVLSTLALATGNSSWLQLAAQYEFFVLADEPYNMLCFDEDNGGAHPQHSSRPLLLGRRYWYR